MKYILGTVQLGLNYGINNASGKPSEEEAFAIFDYAYNNGISILDTAGGYGDSERLIGAFINETGKKFDICSKYSGQGTLADDLHATLEALHGDRLYLYYLHKYEDCLDSAILDSLISFRKKGIVERIGISVYTPDELCFITRNLKNIVNVVQIPFSIVDNSRWISAIKEASGNNIEIYCRSIFLQGAIFKPLDDEFISRHNAGEHLLFARILCDKYNCDIERLSFSFCESFEEISGVLFGCETLAQLSKNISMIKSTVKISSSDINSIVDKMKDINPDFIDPRTWRK